MSVVALAGNPNSGKTTLFNKLTGLNHKVGNYPGVTVERRSGHASFGARRVTVIDLPGTYSLIARSRDEAIAFEVLTGRTSDPRPDVTLLVVDASNLERNLYLALSILELGMPCVIALNMMDVAERAGRLLDPAVLSEALGVPVLPIVAKTGRGLDEVKAALDRILAASSPPAKRAWQLGVDAEAAIAELAAKLGDGDAIWLLTSLATTARGTAVDEPLVLPAALEAQVAGAKQLLSRAGDGFVESVIEARYQHAAAIASRAIKTRGADTNALTTRIDAFLLHPIGGPLAFLVTMAIVFQSIFSWAEPMMGGIEGAVALAQSGVAQVLPEGAIRDLISDGIIGGAGNVIVFVPQIGILSAFLAVLEDSGYLARAAFISDRWMARVGLHGRAFVPLLSGFACAIPAIMATRVIESRRDRIVTILATPFVSCSARLPIYTLVIASLFASQERVLGVFSKGGLLLLSMYLLSVIVTIGAAFALKRTLLQSPTPPLVLELPPYRWPEPASVLRRALERCMVFVKGAGTMIVMISIVLWALLYFPRDLSLAPDARVQASYAGRFGKTIEPAIAPLGFDWKIGIGLLASFAAREVFVSTMGLVYGVGEDADEESASLREHIHNERHADTGKPVYTPLVGLSLMVFFLLAAQCMSTIAIVRRETNSWRWPLFMVVSMTVLAWLGAFVVYQGGRLLGWS